MGAHSHTTTANLFNPLSVLPNTQRQTSAQKEGLSLFTEPWSLSDPPPSSSSCAEAIGCITGGTVLQVLFTRLQPIWEKRRNVRQGWALQPFTACLYRIEWVSICLCHTGLCYAICSKHWPVWKASDLTTPLMSLRSEERANGITLTTVKFPTFYVMVFDTRESSEQTVEQQEHIRQGVAQMVMNMEHQCSASS